MASGMTTNSVNLIVVVLGLVRQHSQSATTTHQLWGYDWHIQKSSWSGSFQKGKFVYEKGMLQWYCTHQLVTWRPLSLTGSSKMKNDCWCSRQSPLMTLDISAFDRASREPWRGLRYPQLCWLRTCKEYCICFFAMLSVSTRSKNCMYRMGRVVLGLESYSTATIVPVAVRSTFGAVHTCTMYYQIHTSPT